MKLNPLRSAWIWNAGGMVLSGLAFTLAGTTEEEPPLHAMFNMGEEMQAFAVPVLPGRRWLLAVDTTTEPGVFPPDYPASLVSGCIRVGPRSLVVLEAQGSWEVGVRSSPQPTG